MPWRVRDMTLRDLDAVGRVFAMYVPVDEVAAWRGRIGELLAARWPSVVALVVVGDTRDDGGARDDDGGDGGVREGAVRDGATREGDVRNVDIRDGDVRDGDVRYNTMCNGDIRDRDVRDVDTYDEDVRDGAMRDGGADDAGEHDAGASDVPVGYLVGEVRAWEFGSQPAGWIFAVGVDPHLEGRGLGRMLRDEAVRRFRDLGVSAIRTMVRRSDVRVQRFFRDAGFVAGPYTELELDLNDDGSDAARRRDE